MYDSGQGVARDYAEAVKWYRLAAKQGYVSAQYNLGIMYAKGQGLPQDYVRAHAWFNIAATQGNEPAVNNRDVLSGVMTPTQLEAAQELSRELWEQFGDK
jgi:TPR repeat protein